MGKFIITYHLSTSRQLHIFTAREMPESRTHFWAFAKVPCDICSDLVLRVVGVLIPFFFFSPEIPMKESNKTLHKSESQLFCSLERSQKHQHCTLPLTGRIGWRNRRAEPQDCLFFMVSDKVQDLPHFQALRNHTGNILSVSFLPGDKGLQP